MATKRRTPGKGKPKDTVKAFLKAQTSAKADSEVAAGILFGGYQEFCKSLGEKPLSNTAFGRRMSELKYGRSKRGGIARYQGLMLKDSPVKEASNTKALGPAGRRLQVVNA